MGQDTLISWTDATWNPVSGCRKISPGCDNCYAYALAERYRGSPAYPVGFDLNLKRNRLHDPEKWKDSRRIFVNSMSDLFHKDIPIDYLREIWDVMLKADQHIYQILTKRPQIAYHRIKDLGLKLPPHIWLGVSVENQEYAKNRIPWLLKMSAKTRFLSCEPLLGPLNISQWLHGLHWVITGGESGNNRRPANYDWFRGIRDQCLDAGVAYYHKQGNAHQQGQDVYLDDQKWEQYPEVSQPTRQLVMV